MFHAPGRKVRAATLWLPACLVLAHAGSISGQDVSPACSSADAAIEGAVLDRLSKVPLPGATVTAIWTRCGS